MWALLAFPAATLGQSVDEEARAARRGGGVRVGIWKVDLTSEQDPSRSLHYEGYFQRAMDEHLALENSLGVWWGTTSVAGPAPGAFVETQTFVVPLLTSLKLFPFSRAGERLEPYVAGGIGFALGVEKEDENAVGGGGTTIVTGIGFRGAFGLQFKIAGALGVSASAKYQWTRFGEDLGGMDTFGGVGADGGLTYRFQF